MIEKLKQLPAVISIVIALFRAVQELIVIIEREGPKKGGGKEKKNLILKVIDIIYDLLEQWIDLPITKEDITKTVEKLIDAIVSFYKIVNIFRKEEDDDGEEGIIVAGEGIKEKRESKFRSLMDKL